MKFFNKLVFCLLLTVFFVDFNQLIYPQKTEKINIAVLNFRTLGAVKNELGNGIQEIIMTNLGQNSLIQVVERARLKAVITELNYSGSDLFDYKKAVKLGKLIQANYIITGSIVGIGQSMRINARIVNVKTASVYKTFSINNAGMKTLFNSLEYISAEIEAGLLGLNQSQNKNAPKIEIAFVIDSTGSMHDEINVVKSKINSILNKTLNAYPRPVVKIAVIDYKDRFDEYITRVFNFTSDINGLRKHLNSIKASGGGDYPERVTDALNNCFTKLKWSKKGASKMIFLVGDAPPHKYNKYKFPGIIKNAVRNGISIFTIACSGLDKNGVDFFKFLAKNTNANFSYLSYKQEYVASDGERTEIITRGRVVYKKKRESEKHTPGSGKPAKIARSIEKRRKWGGAAAEGRIDEDYKKSVPGKNHGEVLSPEKIALKRFRKKGEMQNNLDSILIKNIRNKASKDLKIKYKKHLENKAFGTAYVVNYNIKIWAFFIEKKDFNKIKSKKRQTVWLSASIHKTGKSFVLMNCKLIDKKRVPGLAVRNFNQIQNNINYYEKNGVTNEKLWFFKVSVLKIKNI